MNYLRRSYAELILSKYDDEDDEWVSVERQLVALREGWPTQVLDGRSIVLLGSENTRWVYCGVGTEGDDMSWLGARDEELVPTRSPWSISYE